MSWPKNVSELFVVEDFPNDGLDDVEMESEFEVTEKALLVETNAVSSENSGWDGDSDCHLQHNSRQRFARVLSYRLLLFGIGTLLLIGAGIGSSFYSRYVVSPCRVSANVTTPICSETTNISDNVHVTPTATLQPSSSLGHSHTAVSQVLTLSLHSSVCRSV